MLNPLPTPSPQSNYAVINFGNSSAKNDEDEDEKKSSLNGAKNSNMSNYAQLDFSSKQSESAAGTGDAGNPSTNYADLDFSKKRDSLASKSSKDTPTTPTTSYSQIDFSKTLAETPNANKPKTFVVDMGKDDVTPTNPHVTNSTSSVRCVCVCMCVCVCVCVCVSVCVCVCVGVCV